MPVGIGEIAAAMYLEGKRAMLKTKDVETSTTVQVNLRVTIETRNSLVELAQHLNMSMSEVITELIKQESLEQFYS
jgi:hypothetical protein